MKPQPSQYPISEGTVGYSMSSRIRGVTEVYFPSSFSSILCRVHKFHEEILGFRKTVLTTEFTLEGDRVHFDNPYFEEVWKQAATANFFQFIGKAPRGSGVIAPTFAVMLNQSQRVESAELKIDGVTEEVFFDQSPDILIAPSSYPPLTELPEGDGYLYYEKKSTVFYTPLKAGKRYQLTIQLENLGVSEFVPLFPYGVTEFQDSYPTISSSSSLEVVSMGYLEISRQKANRFPDWLEYHLNRDIGVPAPSHIRPANFWRGEFPGFNPLTEYAHLFEDKDMDDDAKLAKIMATKHHEMTDLRGRKLKEFETFRPMQIISIPSDMDFDISVKTINKPLPTRIYEQLQNLPNYQDVLIEYDVINLSNERKELRFETEIVGITDQTVKILSVPGLNNEEKKPARVVVAHCPRMQFGILERISSGHKATLSAKVYENKTGELIYTQTFEISLLPHDQIIWELRDVRNSQTYNLAEFVVAWVNPTDAQGLLDAARAGAIKYHPDNALGHETDGLPAIQLHAKAVYDYLAKDAGLRYLSQPFTSRDVENSQRVVLPERVLANKAGNCIDLSVLFASILEGFGISTLILMTPGHAFVGWGNPDRTSEMIFLETTVINTKTFEEAMLIGRQNFLDNFLFVGAEDPIHFLMATNGCHIVDVASARKNGIISRK